MMVAFYSGTRVKNIPCGEAPLSSSREMLCEKREFSHPLEKKASLESPLLDTAEFLHGMAITLSAK